MQRVSVIGITGSGKTTIGRRLAGILHCPFIELDSIYHQANWKPMDREKFTAIVDEIAQGDRWIIDGSYQDWTVNGPIWKRADTVVWMRFPKRKTVNQLFWRSFRNVVTRRELWNGNREDLREHLSSDIKRSIFAHVLTNYDDYDRRFLAHISDKQFGHIKFVVLRSRAEAEAWLAGVSRDLAVESLVGQT